MSVGKAGPAQKWGKRHHCPSRSLLTCKCLYGYRLLTGAFWGEVCCCCVYLSPWSYERTCEARREKERWVTKKQNKTQLLWVNTPTQKWHRSKGLDYRSPQVPHWSECVLGHSVAMGSGQNIYLRHIPQAYLHFDTLNFMQSQHMEEERIWTAATVHPRFSFKR